MVKKTSQKVPTYLPTWGGLINPMLPLSTSPYLTLVVANLPALSRPNGWQDFVDVDPILGSTTRPMLPPPAVLRLQKWPAERRKNWCVWCLATTVVDRFIDFSLALAVAGIFLNTRIWHLTICTWATKDLGFCQFLALLHGCLNRKLGLGRRLTATSRWTVGRQLKPPN